MAASGQFRWPPTGSYMAANGQDLMAADIRVLSPRLILLPNRRRQPRTRPIDHIDHPGTLNVTHRITRRPNSQIIPTITIEIG